jgi:predicted  nucleic acid-binding Zn-ribbon protein
MKTQLRRLLLLQDLDALLIDLESGGREIEQALGFTLRPLGVMRAERAQTARDLDPQLLRRYERLRQRYSRAVAAEYGGVCTGCFTVRPSRTAIPTSAIETCERCGRMLFRSGS